VYRVTLDKASDALKARAAERYVTTLREGGHKEVAIYDEAFFRCSDLKYLKAANVSLVKDHVLSQMSHLTGRTFTILAGIGPFLDPSDITRWVDPFISTLTGEKTPAPRRKECVAHIVETHESMSEATKVALVKRLKTWEDHFAIRKDVRKDRIAELLSAVNDELPF
jgi:hypothetical protein